MDERGRAPESRDLLSSLPRSAVLAANYDRQPGPARLDKLLDHAQAKGWTVVDMIERLERGVRVREERRR
jgi:hypothetical protein